MMRRIGVGMYLIGALNLYVSTVLPGTQGHGIQRVLATLLAVPGVLLAIGRPRERVVRFAPYYGITVVAGICATARPLGTAPLFYLWPVVICAYFLPRRNVIIAIAWAAVSFAVALFVFSDAPVKSVMFTGVVSTTALMAVVVMMMREHQADLVAQLYAASTTDSLTGLLNRRAFESAFGREIARAKQVGLALSVVCFDLDQFKQCNDRYGHAGGDRVLRRFAALIEAHRREGDLVARIGGEEFVLILFDTQASAAVEMAEALGRALITDAEGGETAFTFSAGVAGLSGEACGEELLLLADRALYGAKESGRRRVALWDGEIRLGEPAYGLRAHAATEAQPEAGPRIREPARRPPRGESVDVTDAVGPGSGLVHPRVGPVSEETTEAA